MTASTIERQLQAAEDRRQIHEVVQRLASAIDRNDRERILACYHPGATDDHGEFSGTAEGFADWVGLLYRERLAGMSHQVTNHIAEIDGDTAHAETYVTVFLAGREVAGQRHQMIGVGRYLDRLERRAGQWRIATRLVLTDWEYMATLPANAAEGLVRRLHYGKASCEDPSYAHLGSRRAENQRRNA